MMKDAAAKILENLHLLDPARRLLQEPARRLRVRIRHPFKLSDKTIAEQYFTQSPIRKLNIGCGSHLLAGWLNTDLSPELPTIIYLNARQRFPFKDEIFDYIFSEHVIEHISYRDGVKMLTECLRVLKKQGKIRISTPDLTFLIDLSKPNKSNLQRTYIKWANSFIPGAPEDNHVFVINNFVRSWGHTFIYDENTLRAAMTSAGFKAITKFDLHESEDPALRNLENEKHLPPELLRLESLTLEGSK